MSDDYLADALRRAQHQAIVNSEGWDAAARGLPVSACPYPYSSDDGRTWTRGWTARRDLHERTTGGYDQRHNQARALFQAEGHARTSKQTAFDQLMAEIDDALRPDPPRHDHAQCPWCANEPIHPIIANAIPIPDWMQRAGFTDPDPDQPPVPIIHIVPDPPDDRTSKYVPDDWTGRDPLDHQERLT